MNPRPRATRGISTAEVLAGTALSLMTVGTVFTVQQAQLRSLATQATYAQSQTVTRTVIDLMSREVRMAGYNPTGLALTLTIAAGCLNIQEAVTEATATRVHIRQDLNGDGVINAAGEDVVYDLGQNQVRRQDGASAPLALVDNVPTSGLAFKYFDSSNPPVELVPGGSPAALSTCQRAAIAKIRVTVTANIVDPDPRNASRPVKSTAESEVAIRARSLLNI